MEIIEATSSEYHIEFNTFHYHVFNGTNFLKLNEKKCDEVVFLLFKDVKVRLGVAIGINGFNAQSPFSAPFGGFSFKDDALSLTYIDKALILLEAYLISKKIKSVNITLPPGIYNPTFISKCTNSLYRSFYQLDKLDLNYSFDTRKLTDGYSSILWRNARKNLNTALKSNFTFETYKTQSGLKCAYHIIKQNREKKGFPLRMTETQMVETSNVISIDSHIIKYGGNNIAAAIVFRVSKNIVQVVYWGDIPDYSDLRPMNFLAFKVFEFYKESGIEIIDIGPSTENSIPNHGLCEFKEGIGCDISLKHSFLKTF